MNRFRTLLSISTYATTPGLVAPLLRSGVNTLAERAASLLGNLCGEPVLRAQLAADNRAVADLVKLLPASEAGPCIH